MKKPAPTPRASRPTLPAEADGLVTLAEAARAVGCTSQTLGRWIAAGELPVHGTGPRGARLVALSDARAAVEHARARREASRAALRGPGVLLARWLDVTVDELHERVVARYRAGSSTSTIARELDCGADVVRKILDASGEIRREAAARAAGRDPRITAAVVALYAQGWSMSEIERTLSLSYKAVRRALVAARIPLRPPGRRRGEQPGARVAARIGVTLEELHERILSLFMLQGLTLERVAGELGCERQTVSRILAAHGLKQRRARSRQRSRYPDPGEVVCARPGCGRRYRPHPSTWARGRGRFCSRGCAARSARRRYPVPSERRCQLCGKAFTPRADVVARGWGRFCSRRCAALYHDLPGRARQYWQSSAGQRRRAEQRAAITEDYQRKRDDLAAAGLVFPGDAARILKVSRSSVTRYARRGRLQPAGTVRVRVMGFLELPVYRRADVEQLRSELVPYWSSGGGPGAGLVARYRGVARSRWEGRWAGRKEWAGRWAGRPRAAYHEEWATRFAEWKEELTTRWKLSPMEGEKRPPDYEVALLVAYEDYDRHPERWRYNPEQSQYRQAAANRILRAIRSKVKL